MPPETRTPPLRASEPDFKNFTDQDVHDYCDHDTDEIPCEYDNVHAGWDVGTWCRLNFVRQGDGKFYVSVHADREPVTLRSCTADDLRLLAQHLLAVADSVS